MISYGMSYLVTWMVTFFILGVILYIFDVIFGKKLVRKYHDMTHQEALGESIELGVVVKRKARWRFAVAISCSFVQSVLVIFFQQGNPLAELLTIPVETIGMMIGFYIGPLFAKFIAKREKVFDTLDGIESGEINAGAVVKGAVTSAGQRVAKTVHDLVGDDESSIRSNHPEVSDENPSPEATQDKQENPEDHLRSYIEGGSRSSRGSN